MVKTEVTREAVIEALKARGYSTEEGYTVQANDVVKNGVTFFGITIRKEEETLAPTFYLEDFLKKCCSVDEITDCIINTYKELKPIHLDMEYFFTPKWVLENLYIGLQKTSDEKDLVKRPCELDDIEEYLYVKVSLDDGSGTIKFRGEYIDKLGLSYTEVWEAAEQNTFAQGKTVIRQIDEIVSELYGESFSLTDEDEKAIRSIGMHVITNESKRFGAIQVLDKEAIRNYFPENVHTLVVILSSIHECLLIVSDEEEPDLDFFNQMINETNKSAVLECEQLGWFAYVMHI